MNQGRPVRLFRNGRNQVVRIPVEFEIEGSDTIICKDGDRLIIEPVPRNKFASLLSGWEPIEDEFPNVDDFDVELDDPMVDE